MPLLKTGRITFLRAHDVGTGFGPPDDLIDVEAVVKLDSRPAAERCSGHPGPWVMWWTAWSMVWPPSTSSR
jgi:hypothetical protein